MPRVPANISARSTPSMAKTTPTRMPATTEGSTAGSRTLRLTWLRVAPIATAAVTRVGSTSPVPAADHQEDREHREERGGQHRGRRAEPADQHDPGEHQDLRAPRRPPPRRASPPRGPAAASRPRRPPATPSAHRQRVARAAPSAACRRAGAAPRAASRRARPPPRPGRGRRADRRRPVRTATSQASEHRGERRGPGSPGRLAGPSLHPRLHQRPRGVERQHPGRRPAPRAPRTRASS